MVAIKKLHVLTFANDDESRLYDEINIVLNLKHKNIVRPLGYCHKIKMVLVKHEGKFFRDRCCEFYFVEEYMPNGSMSDIISGMFVLKYILIDYSSVSKNIYESYI